jgi:hypothetical protein
MWSCMRCGRLLRYWILAKAGGVAPVHVSRKTAYAIQVTRTLFKRRAYLEPLVSEHEDACSRERSAHRLPVLVTDINSLASPALTPGPVLVSTTRVCSSALQRHAGVRHV